MVKDKYSMDNIQFLIVGILVVLIIGCIIKRKEGWYYTQAYYPYRYTGGYGSDYPYYTQGYKGQGSYIYPGYTPKFAKQMEQNCKLGCLGNVPYAERHKNSPGCKDCLKACVAQNPYSMRV